MNQRAPHVRYFSLLALAHFLAAVRLFAAHAPVTQPFEMREDFSGDSLGQWASYPPVQDIGYDPSLSPSVDFGAPGGRSLMRIARPPSPGILNFGFIKRLDMVASSHVKLSFSFRLKPAEPGSLVEISVAGSNGHRYSSLVPVKAESGWATGTASFTDIPPGTELQAIAITARLHHADPDINYRFLIDDISLSAARAARFNVTTPRAVAIEPWRGLVSASTYAPGEAISLSATSPVKLSKVDFTLKDQDGRPKHSGSAKFVNGAWAADSLYTVGPTDSTGVWRAELRGATETGQTLDTDLRFLVRPARSSTHPRLFFSAAEKEALLNRTHNPCCSDAWSSLLSLASESRTTGALANGAALFSRLDPVNLLPTWRGYMTTVAHASSRIQNNALVAYVTGDSAAQSAAKQAMLDVASWATWIPPWFEAHGQHTYYPAGELAADVSLAYDTLYNDLTPQQRDLVRRALILKGSKATYREYVLDNRLMANTSNWIGHTVGGAIVSSLAALEHDDDPDLNIYLGGLLMKFEDHLAASYLSDGSYGEGISYQEFDLKSSGLALVALNRVLGIDYWSRTHVKDSLGYPLYTLAQPAHDTLDMGDSHGPTAYSVAPLVQNQTDPAARWYYDQFPHRSISDFLFPPEQDSKAAPPTAVSRYFDKKGNVVFRSGWKAGDEILLFRAGPNFNHNHGDQGGFLLRAFGEPMAVEGGYADYYNDPYYQTYFSQSSGHNTVLVDGDPASQDIADTPQFPAFNRYPRITDVILSDGFDSVGSDLASVYKQRLTSYTRRIAFLKPHYLVIYDDLVAAHPDSQFDWLLHINDRDQFHAESAGGLLQSPKGSMAIRALAPDNADVQLKNGYLPHSIFATGMPKELPAQPGVVDIKVGPSQATRFLVLLTLSRDSSEASALSSGVQKIAGDGCIGLRLDRDIVLFRQKASTIASCAGWRTDAEEWSSAGPLLAAQQVTSLIHDGTTLLVSDSPVTFSARTLIDKVDFSADAVRTSSIRYHLGFAPAGLSAFHYNPADGTVQLQLPPGHSHFTFSASGSAQSLQRAIQ